jgi:phosphohistidine swiveling domain-containing protein
MNEAGVAMNPLDPTELFKTQISQTEWFQAIGSRETEAFRVEDNDKRERLKRLNELLDLPFDRPYQFTAADVAGRTLEFEQFLNEHGEELCALRLIPNDRGLPKLRTRGFTINDSLKWFEEQGVDASKYRADFVPHDDNSIWATIFIVNARGIFGEITHGPHSDLTQGYYTTHKPNIFQYNFEEWHLEQDDPEAVAHLIALTDMIRVEDGSIRKQIEQEFEAGFTHNYLQGYFETTYSAEFGVWFMDYNRILGQMYQTAQPSHTVSLGDHLVKGKNGSPGKVTGRVRLVDGIHGAELKPDEILVCRMTTPDYVPLMQQAAGIVTDLGGILSHAAIVARELGKPCLTATGNATTVLTEGQLIEVDADAGVVRLVEMPT